MMTRRVHITSFVAGGLFVAFFFYYFFISLKDGLGSGMVLEKGWFLVLSTSRVFDNRIENRNQSNQRSFPLENYRILVAFLPNTTG